MATPAWPGSFNGTVDPSMLSANMGAPDVSDMNWGLKGNADLLIYPFIAQRLLPVTPRHQPRRLQP